MQPRGAGNGGVEAVAQVLEGEGGGFGEGFAEGEERGWGDVEGVGSVALRGVPEGDEGADEGAEDVVARGEAEGGWGVGCGAEDFE